MRFENEMPIRRTMRLLGKAMLLATACGWMPLTAVADFSFEEMEQLERSEQGELLQRARQAANGENFGVARDYLDRARHKGYAPDEFKAVESLIAQRKAAAEERRRQAEEERRRQEEEQRSLAELERQRANSAAVSSGGFSGSDMKNWCLGASGKFPDFCYFIKDLDAKNACLGMTNYPDFCFSIGNADIKNLCLGRSRGSDFCFGIDDPAIKNACLGMTRGKDFCYSSSGNFKLLCAGVAMSVDNCYTIR